MAEIPLMRSVEFEVEIQPKPYTDPTVTLVSGWDSISNKYGLFNYWEQTEPLGASLEHNATVLDGTFAAVDYMNGIWSAEASDAEGKFEQFPEVRFDFGTPMTTRFLMLYYDEPAASMSIDLGSAGFLLPNREGKSQIVDFGEEYTFSSCTIAFQSTVVPNRRVKLAEIKFGLNRVLGKGNLLSATLLVNTDHISRTLPMSQLAVKAIDSERKYISSLQDRQPIEVRCRVGEYGKAKAYYGLGTYYYDKASSNGSTEFVAFDRIKVLDTTKHSGAAVDTTLSEAVSSLLSGLSFTVQYSDGVESTPIISAKSGMTKREVLRRYAQAAMCSVWINRRGVLVFKRLSAHPYAGDAVLGGTELLSYDGITSTVPTPGIVLVTNGEYYGGGDLSQNNYVQYENDCVASEKALEVTAWLYERTCKNIKYELHNRYDLSTDIGDTVIVYPRGDRHQMMCVTGYEIMYNGGLSAYTMGVN